MEGLECRALDAGVKTLKDLFDTHLTLASQTQLCNLKDPFVQSVYGFILCVYMHVVCVSMCVLCPCVHVYLHMCICMHVCVHVCGMCVHVCAYVYMCACICVHACVHVVCVCVRKEVLIFHSLNTKTSGTETNQQ